MKYPNIYACIFKDNRMICLDYTYLDVQNDSLPPNSTGVFDSYIDLPSDYDEIKYYLNYSLYSLDGEGNLPPNIPIFSKQNYNGFSRSTTALDVFVIDPNDDRCNLLVDYGDGSTMNWEGNFNSGYNANVQHSFEFDGQYLVKAKAKDGNNLETDWSELINASISPSTVPKIIHSDLDSAHYKKSYFAQLVASGGIKPYSWQITNGLLPNDLVLNSSTGQIVGLPTVSGFFNFTVMLTDAGTPSMSDTSSFNIYVINNRPVITSDDTLTTYTNTSITYVASANDLDGNSITFDFINYPTWLSKTNSTLYGTTPDTSIETSFTVIATDGALSDTLNVIILVKERTSVIYQSIITYSYSLYPNYPNPFNPNTIIKVSVPALSDALITIYDINGRLVKTIYNGNLKSGFHEFEWKANSIPSGTYFIKFQTASFSRITKCLLLK